VLTLGLSGSTPTPDQDLVFNVHKAVGTLCSKTNKKQVRVTFGFITSTSGKYLLKSLFMVPVYIQLSGIITRSAFLWPSPWELSLTGKKSRPQEYNETIFPEHTFKEDKKV